MLVWRAVCLVVVAASVLWSVRNAVEHDQRARPAPRPNVLLVSIDSLRADHLGSYGYARDTSPNIDRLAREGVLFEVALSSAPWTVPAHMTMLTGLPPEVHAVTSIQQTLSPEAITLAEVMQRAGYETAAFVSGPTVMAHFGFGQGFMLFDESLVEAEHARADEGVTSPGLVDQVDGFLERWDYTGRQAPFFVFLHMWDVHYDYAPPEPYDRQFDPDYQGDLTGHDFEHNPRINRDMDKRDLQHLIALYDGEIRFTDEHLGKLVARLRALGALDDTIVVVTSDHGEEFFEHGLKGHAKTLYDEVIHVPLVVRYPRRLGFGQRIAGQVRMMDLAPTILGLARVPAPHDFGAPQVDEPYRFTDLTPFIAGRHPLPPLPALPAFSVTGGMLGHQQAVRTREAKMIRYAKPRPGRLATEVFDLDSDPGEQSNLFGTGHAEPLLQRLDPELAAWSAANAEQTRLAVVRKPTPRHDAKLRALGYVQ